MSSNREAWQALLAQLKQRMAFAEGMGGTEKIARQHALGPSAELQSGAWIPADGMAFDKVIDPSDLRNEIIAVLRN